MFDSLEKAKAGAINIMDAHSPWAKDWRNGLQGLGQEDEDNYVGFDYNPKLGARGGTLISNEHSDMRHQVTVTIKQMEVNPEKLPERSDSPVDEELFSGSFF